ncbi:MAG: type II toxin-antitoxin system VapC family toxin [Sphingomonadaceae bacterium]|nr:type II toxin-antitoxin system VapC family toxin [Sphingomonadaceae bacterium]
MSDHSFDSNILIDALNGVSDARSEIARVDRRWISRLTWIEVLSKEGGGTVATIERFLGGFMIDEVSVEIASRAAQLRRQRSGLKLADAVILASAQTAGRILVTRNTKDFPAAMPGVRIPYTL